MKSILALSLLISVSAFGKELSNHDENQVIKCAMKIMESRQLNEEVTEGLTQIFEQKLNDQSLKQCKTLAKISDQLDEIDEDAIDDLFHWEDGASNHRRNIRSTLEYAAIGDLSCKVVGVEAQVQVVLGLGAGINFGQCISDSGKRFIVLAPELVMGVGVGVFALAEYTTFELKRNQVVQMSDESIDLVIGYGYAGSVTIRSRDDYETNGYGVGLGMGFKFSTHFTMKLLPAPRSYKHLRENLLVHSVGEGFL